MKIKTRILSFILFLCTLVTMLPMTAIASLGASGNEGEKEDAMTAIAADTDLAKYKQGETQSFSDDGHIGIPYEVTVYYDYLTKGAAVPGYMTLGATPVILYVINADFERVGTSTDVSIIKTMLDRGYAVAVLDYKNNSKATGEALDYSAQLLRSKLSEGTFFADKSVFPDGKYQDNIIVPAGYNVRLNDVFFELDKHGTDGTLEKIVNVWNNDFRLYHKDVVVKWVHSDGTRKATQNGHDASEPVWYSDASGKTEDAENGIYIKVKHTKAEVITDCVKADGTPIDLNLYVHILYPTNPVSEVPVMTMLSSAGYLMSGSNNVARPQMQGFLFKGYAGVLYDYAWIPMGRNDHYGYFDGSSGESKSVTGDNQSYATYTFNAAQASTAAIRYARYLALTEPDTYKFDIDKFGNFGISKAASNTHLGAAVLQELITGASDAEVAEAVNGKINGFYQQLYLPGHHGETRYDVGDTVSKTVDGITIDGGEIQPYTVYNKTEICSGVQMVYSSCGAALDYVTPGSAPQFITVNINDTYNHGYNMQNILTNLCRIHDIPALWYEAEIAHTFAEGKDFKYGVNIYEAFMLFADYYLKDSAVRVTYTDPVNASVLSAGDDITVKFIGEVRASEITKVTVKDGSGNAVNGTWSSAYGDTEWTFTPKDMKGGVEYTLTVPADMLGANGKAMGTAYTAQFYTLPEVSASFDISGGSVTAGTGGVFLSYTVPTLTDGNNALKLRLNVENAAVNTLNVYSAATPTDTSGALIGSIKVSGAGVYELDVTDYVMSGAAGSTVYFYVKTATAESEVESFNESFDSGVGSFSKSSYNEYVTGAEVDGEKAVKIVRKTNEGKFGGEHYYYNTATVLSSNKVLNGGNAFTKDDMGRSFLVKIRIYDTVSRSMRFQFSHHSNKNTGVFDYDRGYFVYWTKAGEWTEITLPYTVYDAEYGYTNLKKTLTIQANATGDTEDEFYIDSVTVYEVFTDVTVSAASLVAHKEGDFTYKAPESESAFEVGSSTYATWKDAINATTNGSTVKLLKNYTFTDSDLVNITGRTSLTVDLNGYRLVSNNTKNSILWIGATNTDTVNITLKNGRVILGDTPLVSYEGSTSAGSGKSINVLIDGVYFTVADDAISLSLISATSSAEGVKINSSISFKDSEIELERNNMPDRAIKLFGAGNSDLKVTYSFNGGSLKIDSLHEVTFSESAIEASVTGDEGFKVYVSKGALDVPTASLKSDDGYYSYSKTAEDGGYAIYTVEKASHSTDYGAIPDRFADGAQYPFIVFVNEAYIGNSNTFGGATKVALDYMNTNVGSTVTVLMRDDHVSTASTQKLWQFNGTLVLDLGGHTMTRSGTIIEGMVETAYNGGYDTELIIKNGTMLAASGHFIAFENKSSSDKNYKIDFEDVTFALANGGSASYVMTRCWGTSGDGITTVDMSFTDCTFDFAGKTEGSAAPSSSIKMFDFSKEKIVGKVTVYGGQILSNDGAISNVTWSNSPNSTDTLYFERDTDNNYVNLSVPNGVTPSATLTTKDGKFGFTTLVTDGAETDVYTLTNNNISTPYGTIPAEKADTNANAFALFMDGKFITAVSHWNAANQKARETLDANPGKTVTILLRKDNPSIGGMGTNNRICFMNGTVVVDLDNHTMISSSTLLEGGVPSSYSGNFDTTYIVKNGTLLIGQSYIFISESRDDTYKKMDIGFESVTFGIDPSTFATQRSAFMASYVDDSNSKARNDITIDLDNCTFDLRGITSSFSIFNFPSEEYVAVQATVNGGKIIADSLDTIAFTYERSISSCVFGKGADGAYTTLTVPEAYTVPTFGAMNDLGKGVAFANGVADGNGNKVYTLAESDKATPYGIIPDAYSGEEWVFAVFQGGKHVAGHKTFASALKWVRDKYTALSSGALSNAGKTYIIYMRDDFVNEESTVHIGRFTGTLIVDLNGHSLTRGNGKSLIEAANQGVTEAEAAHTANIIFKNGSLLACNTANSASGHTITYQSYSTEKDGVYTSFDKTINFTFDGVTFGISSAYANASSGVNSIVARGWSKKDDNSTGVISSTLTFKNCNFDFTGSVGTAVPEATTNLVNVSQGGTSTNVNVIFEGGQIKGDASKIKLTNLDSSDSVRFVKNSAGNYFEYYVTAGAPSSSTAYTTDDGEMYFTRESVKTVSGVKWSTYQLGVKSDECDKAIIPYKYYSNKSKYPFIVVQNGAFVAAKENWGGASSIAIAYLDNEGDDDKVVTVYLVTDYTNTSTASQLSAIRGKLILDLNGYTLTTTKTLLEAEAQHAHTSTVEVKDGKIVAKRDGSGSLIAFNRNNTLTNSTYTGTAHKDFYLTFTNVEFSINSGSTTKNFISVAWNDSSKSAEETMTAYLTFNGCTFDVRNATANVILFNFSSDGEYIDGITVINGGKILTKDCSKVNIYNANDGDTLMFGKYSDAYTTLTLESGNAPTIAYDTVSEGKAFFKARANAGEYILTPCAHNYDNDCDTTCNDCGEVRTVPAHNYTVTDKNDTQHWNKCSVCGAVDESTREGHKGGEANCTDKAECSVCGQAYGNVDSSKHNASNEVSKDETHHWNECTRCGEDLNKTEHTGGEANCTEKAECSVCGQAYGNVDSSKHNASNEVSKDETYHWNECTHCGEDLNKTEHTGGEANCTDKAECSVCGQAYGNVDSSKHNASNEISKDETYHWNECTRCGEDLNKTEHTGGEANCTDKAECSVCGQAYGNVDSSKHNASNEVSKDETHHWNECTRCGEDLNKTEHTGGEANCTEKAECSVCGQAYGNVDSTKHNASNEISKDETYHWNECTRCGEDLNKTEHTGGEANCTDKAECSVCGQAYGNLDGSKHNASNDVSKDETYHWNECTRCGEDLNKTEHVYDNNCDSDCVCGNERVAPHNYKSEYESDDAQHWIICEDCEAEKPDSRADHAYDNACDSDCACGNVRTAPHNYKSTYESDENEHWIECADCGEEKDGTRASHDGEATCVEKATCSECNKSYGEVDPEAHNPSRIWVSENGEHWKRCKNSGCEAKLEQGYCDGSEANCESRSECDICGSGFGGLGDHVYDGKCDSECNVCGAKRTETTEHTYESSCDTSCDVCGEERVTEHTYKNACDSICDVCLEKRTPAAHTGGEATCTKKAVCTVCGNEYGETKAHSYSSEWKQNENKHWHECECGARSDEARHSYGEEVDGKKSCVCGHSVDAIITDEKTATFEKHTVACAILGSLSAVGGACIGLLSFIFKKKKRA